MIVLHCNLVVSLSVTTFFVERRSFGIVLWEVFTCGDVPYCGLSNENVLHQVIRDGSVRLTEPVLPVANVDRL